MSIVDMPIDEVEDVAEDYRRQRHTTPILAQSMNAEGFGDESWVDAKEEPVGQACKSRDKAKDMGVLDTGAADLGNQEDAAGDEKAPEAGHSEFSHYDVRANA